MNTCYGVGNRVGWLLAVALVVAVARSAAAQQDPKQGPPVDQGAINQAVTKGAKWLLEQAKASTPLPHYGAGHMQGADTVDELAVYALLHAGVDPKQPEVVKLLEHFSTTPFKKTYTVAIRAMAMHKYEVMATDRKMAKQEIAAMSDHVRNCAQYLIDNQSQAGYWDYGKEIPLPASKITLTPDAALTYTGPRASAGDDIFMRGGTKGQNTTARPRIVLKRNGWGGHHDNSNTQYAWLGLAAGMASGYFPPQDCLDLGEKWMTDQQNEDGGWNYGARGAASYGSMSAGGLSSLCIALRGKGNNQPIRDVRVQKAIKWLSNNLSYANNPGKGGWHYYWIYSVERAGSTADTEWFGDRPWYKEGVSFLLPAQNADGSWGGQGGGKQIADTCWAILFLRRATKSLVTLSGPNRGGSTSPR
jgi:hypothetical protein